MLEMETIKIKPKTGSNRIRALVSTYSILLHTKKSVPMSFASPVLPPPPPKRMRLDKSSSSSPFKTKLGLVFRSLDPETLDDIVLDIFLLDLFNDKGADVIFDSSEFKARKPTFRIFHEDIPVNAICVVGSNLFIFDGISGGVYSRSQDHRSSVSVLDISPFTSSSTITMDLRPQDMRRVPHVLHPKCWPAAIPLSDGKILIFSRLIELNHYGVNVDFELFDPVSCSSCRELPGLGLNNSRFTVKGYTLHEPSHTFFLYTQKGNFALDLSGGGEWVRVDNFLGIYNLPRSKGAFFITRDAEFCLNSEGIYDMTNDPRCRLCCSFDFHYLPPFFPGHLDVVPLGDDSRDFCFCLLDTKLDENAIADEPINAQNEDLTHPQFRIRVCHADLKTLKDDYESDKNTKFRCMAGLDILTSFKFVINDRRYRSFDIETMFAF